MCGRFTLRTPLTVLAEQFLVDLNDTIGEARPRSTLRLPGRYSEYGRLSKAHDENAPSSFGAWSHPGRRTTKTRMPASTPNLSQSPLSDVSLRRPNETRRDYLLGVLLYE